MAIIKGTPNKVVMGWYRKPMSTDLATKPLFRFDAQGEYRTEDKKIIERARKHFEIVENEESVTNVREFKCKKCDFKTDSKGILMAHYKKEHKEE